MTAFVDLRGVSLSYPVYSVRAQSLRNTLANFAVGGRLLKDGSDIVHVHALENINVRLKDGDRLGIIGHNGAGKTTLLKVIAGVYEPDVGLVTVQGKVSSMIDISRGMDYELTGRENIVNMGRVRGFSTKEILSLTPDIIEFTELGAFVDLPMKTYSAGMTTRLIFAIATSMSPEILVMDEWIGAGDKFFYEKAKQRLNSVLSESKIIVLASHNWSLIQSFCNKVLVLNSGKQVYYGDIEGWDEVNDRPM